MHCHRCHDLHHQRDQVCCVDADPAEHGTVRRPRRLSHHLWLSTQVWEEHNTDHFDNDISPRSFTNSLRANFIDYDNVIICSNDNLATDNGQVWRMIFRTVSHYSYFLRRLQLENLFSGTLYSLCPGELLRLLLSNSNKKCNQLMQKVNISKCAHVSRPSFHFSGNQRQYQWCAAKQLKYSFNGNSSIVENHWPFHRAQKVCIAIVWCQSPT